MVDYGRALKSANSTFTAAVGDMQTAVDKTMLDWQGSAASAASGRAWSEKVAATNIDDVVARLSNTHDKWGATLSSIRDVVLRLASTAVAGGMSIADDGTVTPPLVPTVGNDRLSTEAQQALLTSQAADLQAALQKALRDFSRAEDQAADRIYIAANALNYYRQSPTGVFNPRGNGPAQQGGQRYVLGKPTRPNLNYKDNEVWNSKKPTAKDRANAALWNGVRALGWGAGLDDGTDMYSHYRGNSGKPKEFDYAEGYREDKSIRTAVDSEVSDAAAAADRLARSGHKNFSITGDHRDVGSRDHPDPRYPEPETHNWKKTIGSYQQWSHSNVRVEGNRVIMEITVEAADRYNFNPGEKDVQSGLPDGANSRFAEIGWAKPFDSHGSITKTVSWEIGHPPASGDSTHTSTPQRDGLGEDRNGVRTRRGG